jgi:hypothetical protein
MMATLNVGLYNAFVGRAQGQKLLERFKLLFWKKRNKMERREIVLTGLSFLRFKARFLPGIHRKYIFASDYHFTLPVTMTQWIT